ncbi:MAG: hypothetical protein MK132_22370 [Lentisphaerales bacterium]|nr:hypothetical protein [Lentisphaerales bacterium]
MRYFLVIGLLLTFNAYASDFVMVWKKSASLYNDQGRNVHNLTQGEIVEAIIHPRDSSLYMVKYQGKKYNTPKKLYKTLEDMAAYYKKRLIDLDGVLKENDLSISAKNSEMDLMYIKSLELRRDTAVSYRKINYINGIGHIGYSSALSEGKFKKLMKEWEAAYKNASDAFRNGHLNKRNTLREKANIESSLANLDNVLKAFADGKKSRNETLFVKNEKGAKLFKENKLVKHLKFGESAIGTPHTKHPGWFKILVDKKVYTVSGEDVSPKIDYLSGVKSKKSATDYEIVYLTERVEKLQFRLKLVNGISRQLEADKFVAGGYGVVKNYVIPIDKDRTFTIESPDATSLYINSARAERVLREWTQEAQKLSHESLAIQKRIIELQKALIDYEKSIKLLEQS